jgi:hypothetical protein
MGMQWHQWCGSYVRRAYSTSAERRRCISTQPRLPPPLANRYHLIFNPILYLNPCLNLNHNLKSSVNFNPNLSHILNHNRYLNLDPVPRTKRLRAEQWGARQMRRRRMRWSCACAWIPRRRPRHPRGLHVRVRACGHNPHLPSPNPQPPTPNPQPPTPNPLTNATATTQTHGSAPAPRDCLKPRPHATQTLREHNQRLLAQRTQGPAPPSLCRR